MLHTALRGFLIWLLVVGLPTSGDADTVRLGASTPASTLGHPFVQYIGGGVKSSVYDGLTQISAGDDIQPALATSWALVDATTWQFQLRQGVTFHNGRAFDADTVVQVFDYLQSDEAKALTAGRDMANVATVRALSPFVVEFVTRSPDPILDRRLSTVSMIDPDAWRELGPEAYALAPIGTGPYRLIEWGPATSNIILEAYKESWRQPRAVDRVEMVMIPDAVSRQQALLSGAIDLTINVDPDSRDAVEAAGIQTMARTGPMVLALALRTVDNAGSPLRDKRVRQALNYAVDKQTIATHLLSGLMQVASQEVTPSVVGYNPDIAPRVYDPARARALLQEAGLSDGFKLVVAVFSGQVPGDTLIFQQVSQNLNAIGVDVELRRLPFTEFTRRILSGQWDDIDVYSTVWSSIELRDAMTVIDRLACDYTPTVFCSTDMMPQIEAARQEMNKPARLERLQDILSALHDEAPSILLFEYADIVALRPRIKTFTSRSDGILFDQMEIAD